MQYNEIQPLVVTPIPMHGESLMGFILRTSEMNGYDTPFAILNHAGMTNNEMRSVRPPLGKLAKLYNRKIYDFSSLTYGVSKKSKYNKKWEIHKIEIPLLYIKIKSIKICPECVLEKGHIESYWDLKHALTCPTHGRMAVSACSACGNRLKWFRKGLLTCRCGNDLSKLRGEVVEDQNILALLDVIRSKFQATQPNTNLLEKCGFPIKEMEALSLSTLLGIVNRFEQGRNRKTDFKVPKGVATSFHAVKLASSIFANWPNGFYDYLESLNEGIDKPVATTMQRQFHKFCIAFFKRGLAENEMVFLRKAFIGFGNDRWKTNGYLDTRFLNSVDETSNIVGIYGLAKALGVKAPTAMKYVKNGLITGEPVETPKGTRMLYDLSKVPFRKSEGKYHRLREAGLFLGIPNSLLGYLRKEKIYTLKRLGFGLDGYSELDLIEFRDSLINKSPGNIEDGLSGHIPLKKLFGKKKLRLEQKAEFIKSILNNTIMPIGNTGIEISNLVFDKKTALEFFN